MTMFNKDQIFQLLESRDGEALRALWQGRGAVDIAALLDSVEDSARQAAVFRTLPKDLAADVFSYLPGPTQATLAALSRTGSCSRFLTPCIWTTRRIFWRSFPLTW